MPDLFAFGAARGSTRVLFVGTPPTSASVARSTPRGLLRVVVDARPGETADQLDARAREQLSELEAIAETVAQTWSRCDGETPSPADHWHRAGFADAEVVAWLEAGVPWATSAAQLRGVGVEPRDVARELDRGASWSLGLVFARGDVTLAEVQRLVVGKGVG